MENFDFLATFIHVSLGSEDLGRSPRAGVPPPPPWTEFRFRDNYKHHWNTKGKSAGGGFFAILMFALEGGWAPAVSPG